MKDPKELSYTEEARCAAIHALRVNVKSLAAEAVFIRKEISKTNNNFVKSYLNNHRTLVLRKHARHAQLALSCVRGKPYKFIEQKVKFPPDLELVRSKTRKYIWYHKDREKIDEWISEAKKYLPVVDANNRIIRMA